MSTFLSIFGALIAVVIMVIIIWLIVKVVSQTSKIVQLSLTVEDLLKKSKKNSLEIDSSEIDRRIEKLVGERLGSLLGNSSDKIIDFAAREIVNRLSNVDGFFAQRFVEQLAGKVLDTTTVSSTIIQKVMSTNSVQLEKTIISLVEQLVSDYDSCNEDDPVNRAIKEKMVELLQNRIEKEDPVFVEKIISSILERVDSLVEYEVDNYNTVGEAIREKLPEILAAELAKPESELLTRLAEAVVDHAVDQLN